MTDTVIFDLDGTLLNTIADLGEACNHALSAHGFAMHALDEYPHLVGNGVNKLLERALPEGHKDEATVLALKKDFIAYYEEHNHVHTVPYDGMAETLLRLHAKGCRLAVASNKYDSAAKALVRYYFGEELFPLVLGERPNVPRKPDPQIVSDILLALGSSPENTLYVGDSDVDMQTAANAGLRKVACTWGFCTREKLLACAPDFVAEKPEDILDYIS